jgi:hypothetical protein
MDMVSYPALIVFDTAHIEPIFKQKKTSIILFTDDETAGYNAVFKNAAETLVGSIFFITCGTKSTIQKRLSQFS